jgi:putative membrane protein
VEKRLAKRRALISLAFGAALLIAILATHDLTAMSVIFASAGWGLAWVMLWRVLSIFASAAGWRCLFAATARPAYPYLVLGRWIAESINHLLPALQVGGDVVRARLAFLSGRRHGLDLPGILVAAIQVIDISAALMAQVVMVAIGFLLLWQRGNLAPLATLLGVTITILPLVLLLMVQRRDVLRGASGVLGKSGLQRFLQSIDAVGDDLAGQFTRLYRRRTAIAGAVAWHLGASVLRIGETWSALWVFGHPVPLLDAMLIDVMTGAVRSLVFFIPGALGAQEGGILLICSLVGVGPDLALALAMAKRARDLVLGLPGLATWLVVERDFLFKRKIALPPG